MCQQERVCRESICGGACEKGENLKLLRKKEKVFQFSSSFYFMRVLKKSKIF